MQNSMRAIDLAILFNGARINLMSEELMLTTRARRDLDSDQDPADCNAKVLTTELSGYFFVIAG